MWLAIEQVPARLRNPLQGDLFREGQGPREISGKSKSADFLAERGASGLVVGFEIRVRQLTRLNSVVPL